MNDWPIKKFLIVVLSIQIALWGVYVLESLGLPLPLVRQIVGFVYLSFVPGVIILRILKVHNLGSIEPLVYSVGLSIATVMFTGVIVNSVYPSFGISSPISTNPLMISFTVLILALCAIAYHRDRDFSATHANVKGILSPPVLFLCLIPLISILGTQLVNYYQNNILLMLLITLIVLTVILAGFTKFIPERLYPMAVFSITLSLLFYRSLISRYISGFDIHEEYSSAVLVQSLGHWDPSIPSLINSLPAINVLPAVVADISGLSLTLLFKAMYPFLFSVACVGLYQIFRSQTTAKVAFFAVIFIVTAGRIYYDIALIPRQLVASLFLVASVPLIFERKISERTKTLLLLIFGFALILSHYGLAYIYIAVLACSTVAEWLIENTRSQRLWESLRNRLGISTVNYSDSRSEAMRWPMRGVSIIFVLLFTTFAFTWYWYTAGSTPAVSFSSNIADFAQLITTDLFHSSAAPLVPVETGGTAHLSAIVLLYLNQGNIYLKQLLITAGFFAYIWGSTRIKLSGTYLCLCLFPAMLFTVTLSSQSESLLFLVFVFLLFVLFLPVLRRRTLTSLIIVAVCGTAFWFLFPDVAAKYAPPSLNRLMASAGYDVGRLEHIASLFLAPFFIIGGIAIIQTIGRAFARLRRKPESGREGRMAAISIFLGLGLLLETGFAAQTMGDNAGTPSLNQSWVKKYGNNVQKAGLYSAVTPEQDVISAKWLAPNRTLSSKIFATFDDDYVHPLTSYGMIAVDDTRGMSPQLKDVPEDSYVYLQYLNVVEEIGTIWDRRLGVGTARHIRFELSQISYLWDGKHKIYSNGGSEIYK